MIAWARRVWRRLERTLPLLAWKRYGDLRGNRLAGACSFYGFVSLFPLLLLGASVVSAVAGPSGVESMQEIVDENLPGLRIDVEQFYDRAGTLSVVGAAGLLLTGLGWVDAVRAAVRSMWGLDDQPGNIVVRKALDVATLTGLGVLIVTSWGASVVLGRLAADLLDAVGMGGGGAWALQAVSAVLSVGVSALLFGYLLSGLPRIVVPARNLALVALGGAVVFELLKQFLVQYVAGPASRHAYAAFAAPLAVLAWIYVVTRLLMVLAALTAESAIGRLEAEEAGAGSAPGEPSSEVGSRLAPVTVELSVTARQARAVGIAAGAVLGVAGAGLALLTRRAVKAAASTLRHRSD